MTVPMLELDALVRSIEVNKGSPHAIFLVAGASLTSGVPSAANCVLQWKRSIFETNNPEQKSSVAEISLLSVQKRIDVWLKANGIWPAKGEDDYGFFIQKCHPIEDDRRKFFQRLIKEAKPHTGYQLLGLLGEEGIVRSVWTTNFDGLVAKALLANSTLTPIEIGIDSQRRADRQESIDDLLCVSLHGDYRYDALKNTEEELRKQESRLVAKLIAILQQQSLIVTGYSGRDKSIMEALDKAIVNQDAEGKIFWCGFSDEPSEGVAELLARAHQAGREAFYVPGVGFDELTLRLCRQCLTGARATKADKIAGTAANISKPLNASFVLKLEKTTALIKCNAFPLMLPSEVYSFSLKNWPEGGRWKWLRERATKAGFTAVPVFKAVLAMGTLDQIKAEFSNELDGEIERTPITDADLGIVDSAVHALVLESLVQAIAAHRGLATNGKDRLWEHSSISSEQFGTITYSVHRCAEIGIRRIDSKLSVTIDPTFYVPKPNDADDNGHKEVRKKKLGYQHNREYDSDLKYWLGRIGENASDYSRVDFDFPAKTAAFKFGLNLTSTFAEINDGKSPFIPVTDKQRRFIKFAGKIFPEPSLLFATAAGWNPSSDTFPLRGLANHGPFDSATVKAMPQPDVRLSVICPKPETRMLSQFLALGNQTSSAIRQGEYVVDYKGFANIFGCDLVVPVDSDPNWITIPEILPSTETLSGCRQWTQNVCEALTTLASMGRSVALIATPERWSRFRIAETDEQIFNVHDDVKAFAVRKGIATQFLDQDTWSPYDKSRIWWWLSLAIYTKAMRTPWVLKSLDPGSAFVGLGYSIDRKSANNKKIVLGCSHIYNAQGQGLQFRLRNIQDPRIRRDKNPYLNFNEARQMGEMIRQLFWESHYRLPERVVIHKLFPFSDEEIKGIKAGLKDVKMLELLEINHEPALRFLKSKFINGTFEIDGYPVQRGTTIKISSDELLLWVHGATSAIVDGKTYFQGKRRIPGPVVVRRYAGTSDVATIVNEILGLSKMDWNSGELYSQLPATVQSSKAIARIGRRLAAIGHTSFDYRLFM